MPSHLLAIDQGTTGTTALVLSLEGETVGRATIEFPQQFPQPGWVEHDPREIWHSVETAITEALRAAQLDPTALAAIGITNQRETTLLWDRSNGRPIANAIVWQCRRTAEACEALKKAGREPRVHEKTGLVLDAYFSATKIAWLLDHVSGARDRANRGELAFGTIDSFLIHRLTGGKVHVTDVTNASRTLLMNLARAEWDPELCELFHVPTGVLPRIVGNAEEVGRTQGLGFLPDGIRITGVAGDQQAALFGQACFEEGDAKCTYGTGAFALMNVGEQPILSHRGLLTTIAWRAFGKTTYALEGSAFVAGAAVQWLRDGLGLIASAAEIETLAQTVASSEGVVFVPALAGLGAPHWDPGARGLVSGITRGTKAGHLARATLEGIAFQVRDLLRAMVEDGGRAITRLRVDGGAAANGLLMQFQADIADIGIDRPAELESTGRGAAMLAGIGAGLWTADATKRMLHVTKRFEPAMNAEDRAQHLARWNAAIRRTRTTE